MRRNTFQEAICCCIEEVEAELERKDLDAGLVYAVRVDDVQGPEDQRPQAEVLDNIDGETILFVERETWDGVEDVLREVGIQCDWIE